MLKPQKKGTIFLATFPGFLEAKLSKNLPSQTFHNKNFTFYALKHKNHKEMTRKNVRFSGHLLSSETIRSDTIKKSVNSIRCYQIAFRGLGNHAVRLLGPFRALEIHAESLADTFSTPRKPPGTPHRDLFEPSETMRNASPHQIRGLGKGFLTKSIPPIRACSCWANKKGVALVDNSFHDYLPTCLSLKS